MGIKYLKDEGVWLASCSLRHPKSLEPRTLRRKGFKSEAEAKRAEKMLYHELQKKFMEEIIPKWSALVEDAIKELERSEMSKKTVYSYASMLRGHTFKPWGTRLINTITTQEIRDLVRSGLGDCTDHTRKYVLKCIRAVFKYAVENNLLDRNPTPEMKFRIGDKIRQHLTEPQVKLLLAKAWEYQHPWRYHWALALYSGMRNGELYALTWDRVDIEGGTILVNSAWNSRDGFKETKSGNDRIVSIAPALVPILKELKLQTGAEHFVLPHFAGWDRGEQALELRRFLLGLGLPQIRFHDLRATWATLLLSKGVEAIKIMSMGGWKNYKTMQHYIRKAGVDVRGATDCLNLHTPSEKMGLVLDFETR